MLTKKQLHISDELTRVQTQISYMTYLLNEQNFTKIQLMFFSKRNNQREQFNALDQNNFEFDLQFELVKLLTDNLEQLRERLTELQQF